MTMVLQSKGASDLLFAPGHLHYLGIDVRGLVQNVSRSVARDEHESTRIAIRHGFYELNETG